MVTMRKTVFDYPIRIRYRGLYDFDGLMKLIRGYFARMKFDKVDEPKYKYNAKSSGVEFEFRMLSERKVTHYIRIHMRVDGHIWNMKRQEVVEEGKKVMRSNGRLELKITGEFELDYRGRFKEVKPGDKGYDRFAHSLDKWMQDTLDKEGTGLMFGDNKATGKGFVEKMIIKFADEIKTFLKMECV